VLLASSIQKQGRRPVNEYIAYLEAKLAELEAQRKLLNDLVYYKEAVLRRYRAQLIMNHIAY
jgi:hypothetical protein